MKVCTMLEELETNCLKLENLYQNAATSPGIPAALSLATISLAFIAKSHGTYFPGSGTLSWRGLR